MMKFYDTKIDNFFNKIYEYTTDKLVTTLVASAVQSLEAQPLSTVESVHEPFDLCRNQ